MLRLEICLLFASLLAAGPAQAVPSSPASNFAVQPIAEEFTPWPARTLRA